MPRRVRLALVLSSFGADRAAHVRELIRHLDRDRFDVHVACIQDGAAWASVVGDRPTWVEEFPISRVKGARLLATCRRFSQWCRDRAIQVVHATDLDANIFALPAAALAGVPVRIAERHHPTDASAARLALQRAALACTHLVIASSRAAAERATQERGTGVRVEVLPEAIDPSRFIARVDRPIRRITTVAPLVAENGHLLLLEAAPFVLRRCPDAEFVIAGEGPLRADLEALALGKGLSERVRFTGAVAEWTELFASSDLFVLPGVGDAPPRALLAAMAAALPIIAPKAGGSLELLENQRTGVLIPPEDARALGFAMLDLIQWRAHAAALGSRAHAMVAKRHASPVVADACERLYLEQLAGDAASERIAAEMVAS